MRASFTATTGGARYYVDQNVLWRVEVTDESPPS